MTRPTAETYLTQIAALTSIARTTWLSLLAACAFTWVAIASLSDAQILLNSSTLALPIIGTEIPARDFLTAAPAVLVLIFIYLHVTITRLWWLYAQLPRPLIGELPLSEQVPPWIVATLLPTEGGPVIFKQLARYASYVFVWGLPLATIIGAGGRYVAQPHLGYTLYHAAIATLALGVAVLSLIYVRQPLNKTRTLPFYPARWKTWAVAGLTLGTILFISMQTPYRQFHINHLTNTQIDLADATLSEPRETWLDFDEALHKAALIECGNGCTKPSEEDYAAALPALLEARKTLASRLSTQSLAGLDIRDGDHQRLFAVGADLSDLQAQGANLSASNLEYTDLSAANFTYTALIGAQLQNSHQQWRVASTPLRFTKAFLIQANLSGADLTQADLQGADLSFSHLIGGADVSILGNTDLSASTNNGGALRLVNASVIILDSATDWRNAFGDGSVILPEDHGGAFDTCHWLPEPAMSDAEFYGTWRTWIERNPEQGKPWFWIAPEGFEDVEPLPIPEECQWHTEPRQP
ncbi:MAG: pentapeptide repeat-containing protein [Pseudomonadota bacterium]